MRLPTKEIVCAAMLALLAACQDSTPPASSETAIQSLLLSATNATIDIGASQELSAIVTAKGGGRVRGMPVKWISSDSSVAAVTPTLDGATLRAVNVGSATVTASLQDYVAVVAVTVKPLAECAASNTLSLAVGEVRTLVDAEKKLLCVSSADESEYKLVVLNLGPSASVTVQGSGTSAVPAAAFNVQRNESSVAIAPFRFSDVDALQHGELLARAQSPRNAPALRAEIPRRAEPKVGDIEYFSVDFKGMNCQTVIKRPARVIAVLPNVVVYADQSVPFLGYTDQQMATLGAVFDTLVYPVDTLNFGPTGDVDGDKRVTAFFTPVVYERSAIGVFFPSDILPVSVCAASNEREMVYLGVPTGGFDPEMADTTVMMSFAPYLFAHELQHVIHNNVGGNVSSAFNEALSNSSWEMLFYRMTGLSARSNVSKIPPLMASTYRWLSGLHSQYFSSIQKPESASVYASSPSALTMGAYWHLFRFGIDRLGGDETKVWRALARAKSTADIGTALGGNFASIMRANAVSHVVDDAGVGVSSEYDFPSWNFRSMFAGLQYPLIERDMQPTATTRQLLQGGTTYFRFRVGKGATGTIRSSANVDLSSVNFMLVRSR